MKIIRDYNSHYKVTPLKIVSANYTENFKISILFSNNSTKEVDFESFLKNSLHPAITRYLEEDKFKNFQIIDGNLNWNDYDLIFPIEDLYNGKL